MSPSPKARQRSKIVAKPRANKRATVTPPTVSATTTTDDYKRGFADGVLTLGKIAVDMVMRIVLPNACDEDKGGSSLDRWFSPKKSDLPEEKTSTPSVSTCTGCRSNPTTPQMLTGSCLLYTQGRRSGCVDFRKV
jgi:hypothetical protein